MKRQIWEVNEKRTRKIGHNVKYFLSCLKTVFELTKCRINTSLTCALAQLVEICPFCRFQAYKRFSNCVVPSALILPLNHLYQQDALILAH